VVLFLIGRRGEPTPNSPISTAPSAATSRAITTPDSKAEVLKRLNEILQVREQAIRRRDSSLFDKIYTKDCSCVRAGKTAVSALTREHVKWSDR
jgi:hypothetical protein